MVVITTDIAYSNNSIITFLCGASTLLLTYSKKIVGPALGSPMLELESKVRC